MGRFLTAQTVAALKPRSAPYYVADSVGRGAVPGLAIRVAVNGSKSWSYRFRFGTRLRALEDGAQKQVPAQWRWTIGGYPALSLADAREKARAGERRLADGKNPMLEQKQQRTSGTFESLATDYVEKHAKRQKKSWKYDEWQLQSIVVPRWRNRLARDITREDVNELLRAVVVRGPVLANRTRALLSKVFNFAIKCDDRFNYNVVANPVDATERPGEESTRERVLTRDELRAFWKATTVLTPEMQAFWQLRLLTAQRGGEVGSMEWAHVDLQSGWWTIPAASAKNKSSHRVPLSMRALRILQQLKVQADERQEQQETEKSWTPDYVLRLARGKRQQREAASTFQIADFRGHDLRRLAATLMAEAGIEPMHIAYVLNHKSGARSGITWVYNRFSYDPQKRLAIDRLESVVAEIVGSDFEDSDKTTAANVA